MAQIMDAPERRDGEDAQQISGSRAEDLSVEEMRRIKKLEEAVVKKLEERADLQKFEQKLEEQAHTELTAAALPKPHPGSIERKLLLAGAALTLIILPVVHYFWGTLLAVFSILLTLISGLTSEQTVKRRSSFNLFAAAVGMLVFAYSGIHEYNTSADPVHVFLFWMDQLLAFIFLFATYFATKTYRKTMLERAAPRS